MANLSGCLLTHASHFCFYLPLVQLLHIQVNFSEIMVSFCNKNINK